MNIDDIIKYIFLFFIYSFAGWLMETIRVSIKSKRFIDRGFLIGPYCRVYGCGLVFLIIALNNYKDNLLTLFLLSMVYCGILEYFTSWIMEKIFNARWWDYTDRKFNLNGRVCLGNLLPFGIAGTIIVKFINPYVEKLFIIIPTKVLNIITISFMIVFSIDVIVSYFIIYRLRKVSKDVALKEKDNTEEISQAVKEKTQEIADEIKQNASESIEEFVNKAEDFREDLKNSGEALANKINTNSQRFILEKKIAVNNRKQRIQNMIRERYEHISVFHRRIINAFPSMEVLTDNIKDKFNKINK